MGDPCEEKSYRIKLNLSIIFGSMEFTSEKDYDFDISGDFKYTEEELIDIGKSRFIEEYDYLFSDVDITVSPGDIKKIF